MKQKSAINTTASILTLAIVLMSLVTQGQERYAQSGTTNISIAGTSTIHAWEMTSRDATYDAVFEVNSKGEPVKLTSLVFSIPAESLKSGKGAMDKNAYTALKTNTHKQITFRLTGGKMDGKNIQCSGSLTVAGTTKQIDVETVYTLIPGNSLQCKGSQKMLMTDYNIEPPSFMFGSVTTGNEITVSFDVTLASKKLQPISLN